jgi:hypothetical protein
MQRHHPSFHAGGTASPQLRALGQQHGAASRAGW